MNELLSDARKSGRALCESAAQIVSQLCPVFSALRSCTLKSTPELLEQFPGTKAFEMSFEKPKAVELTDTLLFDVRFRRRRHGACTASSASLATTTTPGRCVPVTGKAVLPALPWAERRASFSLVQQVQQHPRAQPCHQIYQSQQYGTPTLPSSLMNDACSALVKTRKLFTSPCSSLGHASLQRTTSITGTMQREPSTCTISAESFTSTSFDPPVLPMTLPSASQARMATAAHLASRSKTPPPATQSSFPSAFPRRFSPPPSSCPPGITSEPFAPRPQPLAQRIARPTAPPPQSKHAAQQHRNPNSHRRQHTTPACYVTCCSTRCARTSQRPSSCPDTGAPPGCCDCGCMRRYPAAPTPRRSSSGSSSPSLQR